MRARRIFARQEFVCVQLCTLQALIKMVVIGEGGGDGDIMAGQKSGSGAGPAGCSGAGRWAETGDRRRQRLGHSAAAG